MTDHKISSLQIYIHHAKYQTASPNVCQVYLFLKFILALQQRLQFNPTPWSPNLKSCASIIMQTVKSYKNSS